MMDALVSSSFGPLLLVKSTALLGLVFVVSFALRKASASTQHYLWTLAFASLLVLPLLAYTSQTNGSWRIALPILKESPSTAPGVDSDVVVAPTDRPSPGETSGPTSQDDVAREEERAASAILGWPPPRWIALALWAFGAALFLSRLLAGVAASCRARRRAHDLTDEAWLDLLGDAQARIGVLHDVGLRKSPATQLPMTIGILRPTILLPEASDTYSPPRRGAVLLHELAHIRRRDCLTQLISQTACAFFWWHPLAWIGARKMRTLSERASDDLVLDAGAKPSEYAHDLLDMARGLTLKGGRAPIASVTMAHRSRLEDRLLAILDPALTRRTLTSRTALPAALVGLAIVLSVALAMPTVAVTSLGQPGAAVEEAAPPEPERAVRTTEPAAEAQQAVEQNREDEDDEQDEETEDEPLTEAQQKARTALIEALDDPNASVREQALGALVRLRDPRTVPYLAQALESDDAGMREQAAWGLGQMKRREAAPSLIGALSDEVDGVREQSAWGLGMMRSEQAIEALGRAVTSDRSSNVREQSAWALGMIRNEAAVDSLVAAIGDDNANVREQASWALGMIRDPRGLEGLSRALRDDVENVREQAIWAVGMLRSPESFDVLVTALGDASADVREQAAWALGMLRDARAVDALSRALKDEDADVREQAAWAIGQIARGGDGDVDLDLDLNLDLDLELDDVNPNPNPNSNPNPNPNPDDAEPEPERHPQAALGGIA